MIRLALPLIAVLALTACDKIADVVPSGSDDTRRAEGKVEGGAISDAMIPLDSLTSSAPPMKESAAEDGSKDGKDKTAAEPAADRGPGPAPAAEPASEPAAEDGAAED